MVALRTKQAAVARKALKATRAERTPEQVAKAAENRRYRERMRRKMASAGRAAKQTPEEADAKKKAYAKAYRKRLKADPERHARELEQKRARAAARRAEKRGERPVPPSKTPEKQREYQARYAAKRAAAKVRGNGHSEPQEMHVPLEAIPDRGPSSLRERGPSRVHAVAEASIGGFNANKLLVLEIAKLFNRLLDG